MKSVNRISIAFLCMSLSVSLLSLSVGESYALSCKKCSYYGACVDVVRGVSECTTSSGGCEESGAECALV
jgi:hypothetical protein